MMLLTTRTAQTTDDDGYADEPLAPPTAKPVQAVVASRGIHQSEYLTYCLLLV